MKRRYRRIVAKFGTNLLTNGGEQLDLERMASLVDQVARLRRDGVEVIVVTSGAVAAGRSRLGAARVRRDLPFRQVLAAVGQGRLMQAYDSLFEKHDVAVAQTLLTRRDLSERLSYLNARNTLLALLHYGVVPIINENDAVALEELAESRIGENDTLAALTANLVDADLLALLMTRDGLYTADPSTDPDATLVRRVDRIDATVEAYAGGSESGGSGGMVTKLSAARLATAGGADAVIASGREPDVLPRLVAGEQIGTFFPASADRLESRKRWILSGLSIRGSIVVDDGAAKALVERKTSLLPAGVKDVCGEFERGETVEVATASGRIACGITNYSSAELMAIRGAKSAQIATILGHDYGAEAVHRDNLVLV
ncbi:MAG TPA: glutamate 5-kinase [Dehalococcoidia bacterium]|nr:glutamate 5-kinase [Dehalococcoidia bacterium]